MNLNRKSYWQHKKYGKKKFVGDYRNYKNGRSFILSLENGAFILTFKSYQQAQVNGWRRLR